MYLRLSADDDDNGKGKTESESITNQRSTLQYFISHHKELSKYPVMEFADDGFSGTNFNRPGIQGLLGKVREGRVYCIVVKDLSRFGRNYIEVGDYIEQIFPLLGVRFISVSDNFDSENNLPGLETGFKNLIHDLYCRDVSKKIKSAKKMMQKEGKFLGGCVPYGYKRANGADAPYIIDPEPAKVVHMIFQWAADGTTMATIAYKLNEAGILVCRAYKNQHANQNYPLKNPKRSLWGPSQVSRIIRNEVYIGTFIGNKTTTIRPGEVKPNKKSEYIKIRNHHEKIVDENLFLKAQEAVKPVGKRAGGKRDNPVPLMGKVICGFCGYCMNFRHVVGGDYFYCRMGDSCSHLRILVQVLEDTVRSVLQTYVEIYENGIDKSEQLQSAIAGSERQKRMIEKAIKHCKEMQVKAYCQWKDGKKGMEEYISEKEGVQRNENEYLKQLERLNRKIAVMVSSYEEYECGRKSGQAFFSNGQILTKELVDEMIERIEVFSNDRIEIQWKFQKMK